MTSTMLEQPKPAWGLGIAALILGVIFSGLSWLSIQLGFSGDGYVRDPRMAEYLEVAALPAYFFFIAFGSLKPLSGVSFLIGGAVAHVVVGAVLGSALSKGSAGSSPPDVIFFIPFVFVLTGWLLVCIRRIRSTR